MKKALIIGFLFIFVLTLSFVLSQSSFNMDCYQKYQKCVEENKEAKIPCYFELCNFEQCICKETTVPNPITHMDDTDPGAWGTAITVCSPWSDLIGKCVEENYGKSRSETVNTKVKIKIELLVKKLENIKSKIKKKKTRGKNSSKALAKIDKQIKNLKKMLGKSDKR